MNSEKQEKWLQRIMAVICLLIIFFVVFDDIKNSNNNTMTEEDKQIERTLDGENAVPVETAAE